jgi:RHS repeat-associated protein
MDDYYPFGLTFNSYSRENSTPNLYQYNGKEKQDELGLDWFDYGKRMYMPEIGRWYVIDALSESLPSYTPYRYALNNPISYIDVGGYIEWPVKGTQAVNKKDYSNGAWGLENTVVRTSTYLETDRPKGASNPHVGIDYRASENTDFYSLGDGKVVAIGTQEGGKAPGAKYITVEYSNGDRVSFVHINSVADGIKVGDKVYEGQIIGKTGATGTKQAHLHITAKDKDGNQIDPENQNYGSVSSADFFGKYGGDYTKLAGYQADHASATAVPGSNSSSESKGETKVKETKKAIKVTNINTSFWSDFLDKASRGHSDLMNWLKNGAR